MDNKYFAASAVSLTFTPPPFRLTFGSTDGGSHGTLFEQADGTLAFTGDVDKSAAVFFDSVIAHHANAMKGASDRIARLAETAREALASSAKTVPAPAPIKKMPMIEFIDLMLTEPAPGTEHADELKACRAHWEAHRGRLGVFSDFWQGWLACSTVRAKA